MTEKTIKLNQKQFDQLVQKVVTEVKLLGETLFPNLVKQVQEHDKILIRGNGKPSLMISFALQTEAIKNLHESQEQKVAQLNRMEKKIDFLLRWGGAVWLSSLFVVGTLILFVEHWETVKKFFTGS